MTCKNPLYDQEGDWPKLSLLERLECIRLHYCTGPCGQSHHALDIRSRASEALKEAMALLSEKSAPPDLT